MSVAFLIIGAGIVGVVLHWTMDQGEMVMAVSLEYAGCSLTYVMVDMYFMSTN